MTRLARLTSTLVLVALCLDLSFVPMRYAPQIVAVIFLASIAIAVLVAIAIDIVRPVRRIRSRS